MRFEVVCNERSCVFDSDHEARKVAAFLWGVTGGHYGVVARQRWEPLGPWTPDTTDRGVLETLGREGLMVSAIKFAMGRSGVSLKEAKDWCDVHLPKRRQD